MTAVLPVTLQHRPMRPEDATAWAELLAAIEEADRRGESYDAGDCAEELADPELDVDRDTVLVLDGDELVAYQVLWRGDGGADGTVVRPDAAVHPAHRGRGIGTALVELARERAAGLGARLHCRVAEENAGAVALMRDSGLVPLRWWSELRRDLDAPPPAVPAPDGLVLHLLGPDYDAARWDEPLRLAHNAAFADHWGSTPVSAQAWAYSRTGTKNFQPGCSVAALAGSDVAGYVMGYEYAADTARTGVRDLYVATVGTLAAWRGRGLAGAMLAHVLTAAAEQGFGRSSLTVDSQNPTGALGVYERAGYALHRREVTFSTAA